MENRGKTGENKVQLEELYHGKNGDKEIVDFLLKSNKPVLIYGSANHAEMVQVYLKKWGIGVEAFIIDDEFYEKDFLINGIKVTSVKNFIANLENYNIVIGFCNVDKSKFIINNPFLLKTTFCLLWEPLKTYEWSINYLKDNWKKFMNVYNNLADDLSRTVMSRLIEAKLNFNGKKLLKVADGNQYFNELTFCIDSSDEIFVDCGSFNGDTVEKYVQFVNHRYKKVYAFEPNRSNIEDLKKRIKTIENVKIIEKGTWNKDTILEFSEDGSASQIVGKEGNTKIQVTTIDKVVGNDDVTFIKMDVEGSELESLEGAEKTIKRNMPKLAICCYHKCDDIINLYSYIHQFENSEYMYQFYLRHHSNSVYETVLYAIPVKKEKN